MMNSVKDLYREDVDFNQLAEQNPEFRNVLAKDGYVDFSDPNAVQQLTRALLKRDFDLSIVLPDDRLCPPVPNRLRYLLWIQDILDSSTIGGCDQHDVSRTVRGLDIGTGASCIYPLLGCAHYPNWYFTATDIDDRSLEFAARNIALNKLNSRVQLVRTSTNKPILTSAHGSEKFDFTMCNPPFYSSETELEQSAAAKQKPPNSACTGAPNEMVCPGGETAFVSKMIDESLHLKQNVQWFTSMLGKFSSVAMLVEKLKGAGLNNWAVMEFVQGSRTRRWGIAWSFHDLRPSPRTARGISSLPKHCMPFPSQYSFRVEHSLSLVTETLNSHLKSLALEWKWNTSKHEGIGFFERNTWSRSSRRRKPLQSPIQPSDTNVTELPLPLPDLNKVTLGVKIFIGESETKSDAKTEILIRWLKGDDTILYESFCGMTRRELTNIGRSKPSQDRPSPSSLSLHEQKRENIEIEPLFKRRKF